MLKTMRESVCAANKALKQLGLVILNFGNVSEIDRERGLVVIKPSGIPYDVMRSEDMVVVDLDGNLVDGTNRPSSDTETHLELYRAFPKIGAVAHTHSRWATVFAQAGESIPMLGTTHADTFLGPVPCTRLLHTQEIAKSYEKKTGQVIVEAFPGDCYKKVPAALVCSHGPFVWGDRGTAAVETAAVLEQVAMMAWHTLLLNKNAELQQELAERHFFRKHGEDAYYGQQA